jgi:hypothetical protein
MFEHGLVEELLYVCETCILCLSLNVLKFFLASFYTQMMTAHKISGFSGYVSYYYIFLRAK